jgi:hypothetical protein
VQGGAAATLRTREQAEQEAQEESNFEGQRTVITKQSGPKERQKSKELDNSERGRKGGKGQKGRKGQKGKRQGRG